MWFLVRVPYNRTMRTDTTYRPTREELTKQAAFVKLENAIEHCMKFDLDAANVLADAQYRIDTEDVEVVECDEIW